METIGDIWAFLNNIRHQKQWCHRTENEGSGQYRIFFESIYQTVVINHNYVNVIYYSTFKKYNFKKSKLTLSLNIFEVVYIWQHEKSWPRIFSFPRTTITVVSTHSRIFWMILCFSRCLVYLGTQACLSFGLSFLGKFCRIPKFLTLCLAKIKKSRNFGFPNSSTPVYSKNQRRVMIQYYWAMWRFEKRNHQECFS